MIKRKGPAWSIVVRCDGSPAIGFGHVVRSLALARELQGRAGAAVCFAMREGPGGMALVVREGYRLLASDSAAGVDGGDWIGDCVRRTRADALVLDVRDALPRPSIERLRAAGVLIATIDDPTERRLAADLAFYPPIPQIDDFPWQGFTGTRLVGCEWVVLRRAFARPPKRPMRARPVVLVTMGGSDPAGMTLTAIESLGRMTDAFDLVVVLGPGYAPSCALDELLARLPHRATVLDQPTDMRATMLDADLAVASFGVTAYELAATGTPAVYMCLTDDHARSATFFETHGAAINLGVYSSAQGPRLCQAVAALVADAERRRAMGRAARALIDGRGVVRVADRILAALAERRAVA